MKKSIASNCTWKEKNKSVYEYEEHRAVPHHPFHSQSLFITEIFTTDSFTWFKEKLFAAVFTINYCNCLVKLTDAFFDYRILSLQLLIVRYEIEFNNIYLKLIGDNKYMFLDYIKR